MTLYLWTPGELWVTMLDYLKGVMDYFPEVIKGISTIPVANHLFQVRPEDKCMLLYEERVTASNHTVSQLLFVTPRASKDIKTSIDLILTRVRIPDEDDWGKLVRVLRYIRVTLHLPLILRADSLNVIKWWVDASFATQPDCKGHTGTKISI